MWVGRRVEARVGAVVPEGNWGLVGHWTGVQDGCWLLMGVAALYCMPPYSPNFGVLANICDRTSAFVVCIA